MNSGNPKFFLFNKLFLMFFIRWTVSKYFATILWVLYIIIWIELSELNIFISVDNAFTLAEWSLVSIPPTQTMMPMRLSTLSVNFSAGTAGTTKDMYYFNPTTINEIIPLYKFLSSPTPTYSPDWYCADFCK